MEESNPQGFKALPNFRKIKRINILLPLKFGEGEGLRSKIIKYYFGMEESNPQRFEALPNFRKIKRINILLPLKFGEGEGLRSKTIKYCFGMEESNPRGFEALPNFRKIKRINMHLPLKFGEGGIRTLGGVTPTTTFEVVTLNRSDTSPLIYIILQTYFILAKISS